MPNPIKQGDSIALSYAPQPPQDITPWAVEVRVKPNSDKTAASLVTVVLTGADAKNQARIGLLDTAALTPGTYHITAKLENSTTGESKEIHDMIDIETTAF
jgi:hypothetical protein